jgi:hypothetical protein
VLHGLASAFNQARCRSRQPPHLWVCWPLAVLLQHLLRTLPNNTLLKTPTHQITDDVEHRYSAPAGMLATGCTASALLHIPAYIQSSNHNGLNTMRRTCGYVGHWLYCFRPCCMASQTCLAQINATHQYSMNTRHAAHLWVCWPLAVLLQHLLRGFTNMANLALQTNRTLKMH